MTPPNRSIASLADVKLTEKLSQRVKFDNICSSLALINLMSENMGSIDLKIQSDDSEIFSGFEILGNRGL